MCQSVNLIDYPYNGPTSLLTDDDESPQYAQQHVVHLNGYRSTHMRHCLAWKDNKLPKCNVDHESCEAHALIDSRSSIRQYIPFHCQCRYNHDPIIINWAEWEDGSLW